MEILCFKHGFPVNTPGADLLGISGLSVDVQLCEQIKVFVLNR